MDWVRRCLARGAKIREERSVKRVQEIFAFYGI
jgi:hypothetical protein